VNDRVRLSGGGEWLRGEGRDSDVVLSSRVRVARNYAGFPFVSRARREDRAQIITIAQRDIMQTGLAPQMMWIDLNEVTSTERSVLVERHLISKQHAKGDEPRAVAVSSPDERLSIMVNEEDHLRLQVIRSGLDLSGAFQQIDAVDDAIEARSDYAYHQRFGYLTACPTNVGTGVRVSVMVHLPGLKLTGELEKARRSAKAMNLAVRGFYGEGSEANGDLFQISNQTTLGKTERDLLLEFESEIIPKVIEYERLARRSMLEKRRIMLEDKVHRSLGTLRAARLLKSEEALELLSYVRLGAVTGLLPDIEVATVHSLILMTQPAHLQRMLKKDLDQAERRVERASLVREHLKG
jgi:protein arginine kinase